VFPGIFMWTSPARMMRPVHYLATGDTEYIGSFEQVYMNIACTKDDFKRKNADKFTHKEIEIGNYLSIVASLTPFSDFNQSPRNMYQCQMGKQTMAIPCHSFKHRVDNKLYRIQTPQKPISRTKAHIEYDIDDYPTGTNAIVAVISYTGYDMEDAMILNRGSFNRGFAHGCVYQTKNVDVSPTGKDKRNDSRFCYFRNPIVEKEKKDEEINLDPMATEESESSEDEGPQYFSPQLDPDGLPQVGSKVTWGDPFYCVYDEETESPYVKKYNSREPAVVDEVRIIASGKEGIRKVSIKLRLDRRPIIGDKFSSRHGQKGIMSQLWPSEDMPFSESGMTPDVIINPHAFPSRMTIGMLIECMASKSGCLHGIYQDATPFKFSEKHRAVDYFGEQLLSAGYNYYGNEPMYSGSLGNELRADIYLGVVYYQRLRHMVSDKYQVRSRGPVDALTHQPIKGRKMGGGIRLGEMERDSLLAHGSAFLLHDRLFHCSDFYKTLCCNICGSLVSTTVDFDETRLRKRMTKCLACDSEEGIRAISVPFVFRYLVSELAAMNIRVTLDIK